ncbi:recombination protein RecO [Campylobacter sp. JMF_01 NE2]|uniref:recombination protein RecO n=1 Tax=unclassified Campylobacter TaxID=2593542 RepID=UPI0022E9CD66|nr:MULTISPECIES: recombination protein RecO [unclassified Campylobacter]MDA3050273.1 recombination protein RecO [Campylobacter sp. JMF_15 NE4]MDA3052933.1 recombination protein RecO [Campylobacter sp. JMF_03 NE3]MDA3067264.1 recombination protein RecO [Campylobacter sp. JMF_01 NE2]
MQGFILKVTKIKDEDCIVDVLCADALVRAYRFYGARHPNITQGYKIDFELVSNQNFLPRLSNVMHLGYGWLANREKLIFWQQFIRLLGAHLKDANELDKFYYELLNSAASRFGRQNPRRIIIESYAKILEFEGRLHSEPFCFLCDEEISGAVSLTRGFLPAHEHCLHQKGFKWGEILEFLQSQNSLNLEDDAVERLYAITLQGF